ncbi:hypothetical protein ACXYRP_02905 [Mycoplasma sp. 5912]
MKNIIFKIGDVTSGLNGLTGINNNDVKFETSFPKIMEHPDKDLNIEYIEKLSKNIFKNKENILDKISEGIIKKNKSINKPISEISLDDYKEIMNNFLDIYKTNNLITKDQQENINNYLNETGYKKFKNELIKSLNTFKSGVHTVKKEVAKLNNNESTIQRTVLDANNGYVINIDSNEMNSKNLTKQFFELESKSQDIKQIYIDINDNILWYNNIIKRLLNAQIAMSAVSIFSFFAGIFSFGLGFFGTALSAGASIGLSVAISILESRRDKYIKNHKLLSEIFEFPKKSSTDEALSGYSYGKNVISGWTWNVFSAVKNYKGKFWAIEKVPYKTFFKKAFLHTTGFVLDSIDIYLTKREIDSMEDKNKKINNFLSELENQLQTIAINLENIKRVEWVVVKETPLDKPYNQGGKGGKNLVFKNLKTSEVLTLEQMLAKHDWMLYAWGMQKIYNKKLNEWYIRKLPNKTKTDNLG